MTVQLALYAITAALVLLCIPVLYETKRSYERGRPLPPSVSAGWLIVDTLDILLVVFSAIHGVWRLPLNGIAVRLTGAALAALGVALMAAGMIEFRSARRILGMEASHLITTGIYRWSRNPQFLGWYLLDAGVALAGSSGYALLVALLTVIFGHYYLAKLEEPFLERVFGREYLSYKQRTSRYIGLPRRSD